MGRLCGGPADGPAQTTTQRTPTCKHMPELWPGILKKWGVRDKKSGLKSLRHARGPPHRPPAQHPPLPPAGATGPCKATPLAHTPPTRPPTVYPNLLYSIPVPGPKEAGFAPPAPNPVPRGWAWVPPRPAPAGPGGAAAAPPPLPAQPPRCGAPHPPRHPQPPAPLSLVGAPKTASPPPTLRGRGGGPSPQPGQGPAWHEGGRPCRLLSRPTAPVGGAARGASGCAAGRRGGGPLPCLPACPAGDRRRSAP